MSFRGRRLPTLVQRGKTARPAQGGPATLLQKGVVVVRTPGGSHTTTTKGEGGGEGPGGPSHRHKGEPRCQGRRGGQGDRPQGGRACGLAQWARLQAWNPEVGGSNPSVPTITPNTYMTSSRVLLGLLDL